LVETSGSGNARGVDLGWRYHCHASLACLLLLLGCLDDGKHLFPDLLRGVAQNARGRASLVLSCLTASLVELVGENFAQVLLVTLEPEGGWKRTRELLRGGKDGRVTNRRSGRVVAANLDLVRARDHGVLARCMQLQYRAKAS